MHSDDQKIRCIFLPELRISAWCLTNFSSLKQPVTAIVLSFTIIIIITKLFCCSKHCSHIFQVICGVGIDPGLTGCSPTFSLLCTRFLSIKQPLLNEGILSRVPSHRSIRCASCFCFHLDRISRCQCGKFDALQPPVKSDFCLFSVFFCGQIKPGEHRVTRVKTPLSLPALWLAERQSQQKDFLKDNLAHLIPVFMARNAWHD